MMPLNLRMSPRDNRTGQKTGRDEIAQKNKSGKILCSNIFPLHEKMTVVFKSCQATVIMTFPQLPKCITLDLQTLLSPPFGFNRCHVHFCGLPPFKPPPYGFGPFAFNRQVFNRSSGCYSRPFISHLIIIRIALPDFNSVAQDHYLRFQLFILSFSTLSEFINTSVV